VNHARKLDALNFVLADVRDGLGPYLAVYLLTVQHWDQAAIGLVMSIGGIAGIVAQTPAGALVDSTTAKRAILIAAAAVVTLGSLALPWMPGFTALAVMNAFTGAAGSLFAPSLAAITLGIVGPRAFARRVGRNEAFNHGGNAAAAAIAAATAYWFGPVVVFWVMSVLAVASIAVTLSIPAAAIDHAQARGLETGAAHAHDQPSDLSVLLSSRPLLVFAASATIFHFANAAMLPLVGQKLALINKQFGTSLMAICIVAAQAVMVWGQEPTSGGASRFFWPDLRSWPCAVFCTRCPKIPTGLSGCNSSTDSARASSGRYSRSSCGTSLGAAGGSTSAAALSRLPRVSAPPYPPPWQAISSSAWATAPPSGRSRS